MIDILPIRTQATTDSRLAEQDFDHLEFGKVFSDHMFVVDYRDGEWQDAQIMRLRVMRSAWPGFLYAVRQS